jgi:tetratricopeptide (TPR) repeat protein
LIKLRQLIVSVALLCCVQMFGLLVVSPQFGSAIAQGVASLAVNSPLGTLLDRATALNKQGDALAAYALLKAAEDAYAGSVEFDYLLGICANDAKQPGQAILALERVLLTKPDYLQARAELAKAYALAKETANAKAEFETLSQQAIPAEAKRTIAQYLNALNASIDGDKKQTKRNASFEAFLGFDDNVNFGTALDQWVLAGGLTVVPQGASRPRKSAVLGSNLSANWVIPISGNWELTAGGQLGMRSQPSAHTLDPVNAEIFTGVTKTVSKHLLSSGIQFQHLLLDGNKFRDATGVFAQWQSPADGRAQLGAYIQHHQFSYANQSIRDAKRITAGITAASLSGLKNSIVFVGSAYGGMERSNNKIDHLSFNFLGLRSAVTKNFSDTFRASLVGSFEKRTFQGIESSLFSELRIDNQLDLRGALEFDVAKDWQISPQVIATRNRSTIGPNDYNRTQALLFARYRF